MHRNDHIQRTMDTYTATLGQLQNATKSWPVSAGETTAALLTLATILREESHAIQEALPSAGRGH